MIQFVACICFSSKYPNEALNCTSEQLLEKTLLGSVLAIKDFATRDSQKSRRQCDR